MKTNLRVTIIIPLYNSEHYLRKCLDSVINQTFSNLEIILVNDGSTDSSPRIIDEYALKDNRIVTIHKENGGIGSAYKAAFKVMTGDYVLFVDSDDWLELDAVEHLIKLATENEADLVSFGIKAYDNNGEEVSLPNFKNIDLINTTNEAILKTHFEVLKHPTLVRLYKRDLFKDIIVFEQNIGIDELLTPQLLAKCNRAVYKRDIYYNVLLRTDSISRPNKKSITIDQTIAVYCFLRNFFSSNKNLNKYLPIINLKYFKVLFGFKKLHLEGNTIHYRKNIDSELKAIYKEIIKEDIYLGESFIFRMKAFMIVYFSLLYKFFLKIK